MPRTIALKGDFIRKEAIASSAITPGHLIEFGGAHDLQPHSTVGGPARKAFALENDLIGRDFDAAYAGGEQVQYGVFVPGAEVYALLDGHEEGCTKGEPLESAGNGNLQVSSTPVEASVVAWALETITIASSVTARVKVEVN